MGHASRPHEPSTSSGTIGVGGSATDDLAQRIGALTDRAKVLDTVATCAMMIDAKDWASVAACFTDDAELHFGGRVGTARGGPAAAKAIRRMFGSLDLTTTHMVTNSVVRLDGDEAKHVGYILAQHLRDDDVYTVGARYDDMLRRTADGWRFTQRVVSRIWKVGNPDVLRPETP